MKILPLAALCLDLLLPLPVLANEPVLPANPVTGLAGVDCRRAAAEPERLICADPALMELDRQLNLSYSRLLGKLEANFQHRVREAQRDWIAERDASVLDRQRKHEKPGLDALLRARIQQLDTALVEINSLQFLNLGPYRPMYLLTALPGTEAYNSWADTEGQKVTADNRATRAHRAQPACEHNCEPQTDTWRVFELGFATPEMISAHLSILSYSEGAAHPSNEDVYSRWWLARAGEIKPRDMFSGTAYRKVIVRHVEDYLRDNDGSGPGQPQSAITSALNPDHWGLSDDGMVVIGQGYDYGMGRGLVEIAIPWAAFGKELNPGFKAALERHKGAVPSPAVPPFR